MADRGVSESPSSGVVPQESEQPRSVAARGDARRPVAADAAPTRRPSRATPRQGGAVSGQKRVAATHQGSGKSQGAGWGRDSSGIRGLFVGLAALFTTVLTVVDKFLKAIDLLRNPLIGLAVVAVAVGAMVISAGYVLWRPQLYSIWHRRLAGAGLAVTVVAAMAWGAWTAYDLARPPKGLIVLVADFEQSPGARSVDYARRIEAGISESLEKLKVQGVFVERSHEVYTERDARAKAAARKAAIVIYGWYDDAGVNPRFELVKAPQQYLPVVKQSAVELASLDRLEIRIDRELKEMNYIAAATIGLSYYADGQNGQALTFFDLALQSPITDTRMMGREVVYFYKASSHVFLNQYFQAVPALQEALRLKPDFPQAHRNLAIVYNATCERAGALREADEAVRLKPDDAAAHQLRGLLLSRDGRWGDAVAAYAEALRYAPEDAAIHAAMAEALLKVGRQEEGLAERQRASALAESKIKASVDDAQATAAFADVLYAQNRLDEAATAYQQAIDRGQAQGLRADRLAWLYRSLGLTRWGQKRWSEMIDAYTQATALSPGLYTDQVALGVAYQAQGNGSEAIGAYQAALKAMPCDANTHSLLGDVYQAQGRLDEALVEYREAVKYEPADPVAWHSIGVVLDREGKSQEARSAFEQAANWAKSRLENDPSDANMAYLLGATCIEVGDYPQAVKALQQAVVLQGDAASHYALGTAYYETRDYARALAEYQAALAADPTDAGSAVGMADVLAKLQRPEEAIQAYRQALGLVDDARTHYSLGMVLDGQGRTAEAIAEYQAALKLKDDPLVRVSLAAVYERLGRLDEAVTEYLAALRLKDDPAVHVSLARVYERQTRLKEASSEYEAAIGLSGPEGPYRDSSRAALASVLARLCRPADGLAVLQPALAGSAQPSAEVLYQAAAMYEAQGRTAEAGAVYSTLLRYNGDLPGAHYLAAGFAYRQGRLSDAIVEMDKATKLAPAFSLAWSALGSLYEALGNLPAASSAYEAALKSMPSNVFALSGLAVLALEQGRATEAVAFLTSAQAQQPEYVQAVPDEANMALVTIYVNLGLAYERLGRPTDAQSQFALAVQAASKAVAALPSHPVAQFELGLAYWVSGDEVRAEAAFAEAARCDASLAAEKERTLQRIRKLRGVML